MPWQALSPRALVGVGVGGQTLQPALQHSLQLQRQCRHCHPWPLSCPLHRQQAVLCPHRPLPAPRMRPCMLTLCFTFPTTLTTTWAPQQHPQLLLQVQQQQQQQQQQRRYPPPCPSLHLPPHRRPPCKTLARHPCARPWRFWGVAAAQQQQQQQQQPLPLQTLQATLGMRAQWVRASLPLPPQSPASSRTL